MRAADFPRLARIVGLSLLLGMLQASMLKAAVAETGRSDSGPELPAPATFQPGKLVRSPDGRLVRQAPGGGGGPLAAPTPLLRVSQSPATTRGPAPVDQSVPSVSSAAAESATPGLPPPATNKGVTPRRLPGGELAADVRAQQVLKVCPPQAAKPSCNHLSLADALAQAKSGDVVVLAPGVYEQAALVTVSGIAIKGEPGAHLKGRAVEGKAALVVRADGVVIDGIECSEIRVRDGNGACVRIEGRDITIRNVHFHDNEEGVLGGVGGTVLIEDSVFERNGARRGYSHGMYISRKVELFHLRRTKVLSTKDEGQGVKSRAVKTIIEDSIIAGLDARDSRAIDIPNGGDVTIRRNVLQKGPNSSNTDMIGLGLEGKLHSQNRAAITGNVIVFDQGRPELIDRVNEYVPIAPPRGNVVHSKLGSEVLVTNNTIVAARSIFAGSDAVPPGNAIFATRSQAGLPLFPALPKGVSDMRTQ